MATYNLNSHRNDQLLGFTILRDLFDASRKLIEVCKIMIW